jgi:hypothetical protein
MGTGSQAIALPPPVGLAVASNIIIEFRGIDLIRLEGIEAPEKVS